MALVGKPCCLNPIKITILPVISVPLVLVFSFLSVISVSLISDERVTSVLRCRLIEIVLVHEIEARGASEATNTMKSNQDLLHLLVLDGLDVHELTISFAPACNRYMAVI